MREGGSGPTGHAGDRLTEIGLGEILSVALSDLLEPGTDVEQMIRLCADQIEEVGVDECMKVRGQLRCRFTCQTRQAVRSAACPDLDGVPQQRLVGRNRHDIETTELDIAVLPQPDVPGQPGIQGQLPSSGRKQSCKKTRAIYARPAREQFAQRHISYVQKPATVTA
ncbi:hypothetical protein [Mesorhizobium sp.]|uniref:hypothetical protein n=1 Tax=Mesorhizobium sp. TaxID=1871066 RepID=UPI002579AE2C|nr:hypothetical protein [Mesorhizobium sp.]